MSFNLTKKTDYALVALARLAKESGRKGPLISARQIAESYDLPLPLLMNALKDLHRAGLIESRRGVAGGYSLKRKPQAISIREVIEVLEGPVNVAVCCDEHEEQFEAAPVTCSKVSNCPINTPIRQFNILLNDFLESITLSDLLAGEKTGLLRQVGVNV